MKLFTFVAFATISQKAVVAFAPTQWGQRASFLNMNVEKLDTKTIRVGVIGAGRIGVVHLEAITKAPGVIPVIISNPTISKAEKGESRDPHMALQFLACLYYPDDLTPNAMVFLLSCCSCQAIQCGQVH